MNVTNTMKHERIQRFTRDWNMRLHIEYGLSINGLFVKEFDHLLARVTNHAHRSFDNIATIAHDFYAIDIAIIRELQTPVSPDTDMDETKHAAAIDELINLRLILHCIAEFFRIANDLKLSPVLALAALD